MVDPPRVKHDVFISFRGTDTRKNFTSHLHDRLIRRKVDTYIDYRLERGDEVGPALIKAIKESKMSVIVFSKDYASSSWCLDELACIMECNREHGQHVIPIFYEIDPSEVRYQTGNYESAFAKHEGRFKDERNKVAKWKEALEKASNLSGFDSAARTVSHDSDLVEQVVTEVLDKLNRESSVDLSGIIGAEGRIQKILLELDIIPQDDRVRHLVIWGMGGIGKTTLADAVFHGLSSQFETHCFVANVRERSGTIGSYSPELYTLRNELLRELLGDKSLDIRTPTIGAFDKERLRRAKVLVVLDDVNDSSQLTFLADEVPFGRGSRIIITTRDMQPIKETLLVNQVVDRDVKIYKVDELSDEESRQLFLSNAPLPLRESSEFLARVIEYAAGIPLALKILHPLFRSCESKKDLELIWDKIKKFPKKKLLTMVGASYDVLQDNEREIFLDIACFHKGGSHEDVNRILAACGLFPDDGIKILIDMSLISIKSKRIWMRTWKNIWMHDVIQEFAWNIVSEEGLIGTRSRVHHGEDVRHIFNTNTGTGKVKGISSIFNFGIITVGPRAFTMMENLRFLKLGYSNIIGEKAYLEYLPPLQYLEWHWYPFQFLPSKFSPHNLVELKMPSSKLVRLWGKDQNPRNLRRIDLTCSIGLVEVEGLSNSVNIESINFSQCYKLLQVPDLSKCLKITSIDLQGCVCLVEVSGLSGCARIKSINLSGCRSLVQVSDLSNSLHLKSINLSWCTSLVQVPDLSNSSDLESINLTWCRSLVQVSDLSKSSHLKSINLSHCSSLVQVPDLSNSLDLESIDLSHCSSLNQIPSYFRNFTKLTGLDLQYCSLISSLPNISNKMEYLNLSWTGIEVLPPSIWCLEKLVRLDLFACRSIKSFPRDPWKFKSLQHLSLRQTKIETVDSASLMSMTAIITLDLSYCVNLVSLPTSICKLKSLERLNLSCCSNFTNFPEIEEPMEHLHRLCLERTNITELPSSIGNLVGLKKLILNNCTRLEFLPNSICNLSLLKRFSLDGCLKLKRLPLSLNFCSLIELNLGCVKSLKEIPDCFTSFPLLQVLNLEKTMIETIPPSIEEVLGLKTLRVAECKQLRSLPALPRFLEKLDAEGCTRLSEVSASVIVIAQTPEGLNPFDEWIERYTYAGCLSLDKYARSNIMDNAYYRIMRMATACNRERACRADLLCPGNEIPEWFDCQADGSTMNIELPSDRPDDSDFLGISLCSVCAVLNTQQGYECDMTLKTINGDTFTVDLACNLLYKSPRTRTDHVCMWYYDTLFNKNTAKYTSAFFDFYIKDDEGERRGIVKRCGVQFLYRGEGAKFHVQSSVSSDDEPEPKRLRTARR